MSVTPERRFLGLEVDKADDRTLLGLPAEGALKSGQIEGALEARAPPRFNVPAARWMDASRHADTRR